LLVSSLAQVAKEQMTVLGRFGVHTCTTFWVELSVNEVYISQATFFVAVAAYSTTNIVLTKSPPPAIIGSTSAKSWRRSWM